MKGLKVGKIYLLRFPGIAARVIEPPDGVQVGDHPFLVESLVLRARWWVNQRGEPDNIYSPRLIVATSDEDVIESDRVASVGASIEGYVSDVK